MEKAHGSAVRLWATCALWFVTASGLGAQQAPAVADSPGRNDRSTPRAALDSYLAACRADDYARAARALDLMALPPDNREADGATLARQLYRVLELSGGIDLDALSAEESGHLDDHLPQDFERVRTLTTATGEVDLLLRRVARDTFSVWVFSAATVERSPALHEEFGYGPLGELLPARFVHGSLLGLRPWQWAGLLILTLLAWLLSWPVVRLAHKAFVALVGVSSSHVNDWLLDMTAGPLRLLSGVPLFGLGALVLHLDTPAQSVLGGLLRTAVVASLAWLFLRLVDVAVILLRARLERSGAGTALAALPRAAKVAKSGLLMLALLLVLQSLGVDVSALLVAFVAFGLVAGLAAHRAIADLVGGLTLMLDQPVRLGDVCRYGDRTGTVEDIGLRSTRIRTLQGTLLTVPNAALAALPLENGTTPGRMPFSTLVALRHDAAPDHVRAALADLRRLLLSHPRLVRDPLRVRLVASGPASLDIEVFAWVCTTQRDEFLTIQEDLLLRILDIVRGSGAPVAPRERFAPDAPPAARARGDAGKSLAEGAAARAKA